MTLVGLDLNASRVRAVLGPVEAPRPLPLAGGNDSFPMAISLAGRHPEAGRTGVEVCRRLPHLACLDFLPHLGEPRQWAAGRHCLDAAAALSLVLQRVQPACVGATGAALAVPSYLNRSQALLLLQLAENARLPVLGSVCSSLAVALAGLAEQPWAGPAVTVDVDEHALTWSVVSADARQVQAHGEECLPRANLRCWKERLLDRIADRCVRHSRRDPRDSAEAEQMLFEQLDRLLEACAQEQVAELVIRGAQWCQHMLLRPEEVETFCTPLVRHALDGMQAALAAAAFRDPPRAVLLTETAARLPGLLRAVSEQTPEPTAIVSLPADAVARAAHQLADSFASGKIPRGHVDTIVALTNGRTLVSRELHASIRTRGSRLNG
jgi:hypothetical protein